MSRYVETLEPCRFKQGFYKVPGLSYSVNDEGLVYSYHQGMIPPAFFDERKVEENKYIHADKQLAHRLVAMTFLKLPEGKTADECLVNHLNGLKYDNRKENLEWTDYVGNSVHAYKTGLREDNIPLKSLDVLTGDVRYFYSLWDCARFYEVNGGRVHGYLNRKIEKVLFLERYIVVPEGNPFPPEKEWSKWKISVTEVNHVLFNTFTCKGFIFQKRGDAFRHLGIPVRAERKLVQKANEENRFDIIYQDWIICPYSRFKEVKAELKDQRLPHEERYAKYKPKRI